MSDDTGAVDEQMERDAALLDHGLAELDRAGRTKRMAKLTHDEAKAVIEEIDAMRRRVASAREASDAYRHLHHGPYGPQGRGKKAEAERQLREAMRRLRNQLQGTSNE